LGGLAVLPRRPIVAGVLFGLLTFKPQLGLLIPVALAAGGHWRAFAAAAITALALLAGSVGLVGLGGWEAYVTKVLAVQERFLTVGVGFFKLMMPSPFMAARLLGLGATVGYVAQAVCALSAAAATLWAWRRDVAPELRVAVVLIGTFLVSPYAFNYDMTIISVAVVILAVHGLREGFVFGERAVLTAAWFVPVAMMYLHAVVPVAPLVVVALFAVALRRVAIFSTSGTVRIFEYDDDPPGGTEGGKASFKCR